MWKVYKLINSALDECYAGATDGDPEAHHRAASDGEIEEIDYWDGQEHKITLQVLKTFDNKSSACAYRDQVVAEGKCIPAKPE